MVVIGTGVGKHVRAGNSAGNTDLGHTGETREYVGDSRILADRISESSEQRQIVISSRLGDAIYFTKELIKLGTQSATILVISRRVGRGNGQLTHTDKHVTGLVECPLAELNEVDALFGSSNTLSHTE